jgi:broad-specificity NMP kinase
MRPIVMEITGASGSGKSSLARALAGTGGGVAHVSLRGNVSAAQVTRGALRAAVPFASQLVRLPSRPWYRFGLMVQLQCYAELLRRLEGRRGIVVLDQGPVYLMSIIQRALTGSNDRPRFLRYWSDTLDFWSRALHLVVVLDAPGDLLLDRIRQRGTPHPLLGKSPEKAARDLAQARRSQKRILDALCARRQGPEVLEIATGGLEVEEVARRILSRLATPAEGDPGRPPAADPRPGRGAAGPH